ncbi:unannotated protein [freshwater metagenome]|uniref:Unannotated protein n=1 Tax=freshwater metagenome TaxID=449393 RepID=A0A6J6JVE2_9ZZZZ
MPTLAIQAPYLLFLGSEKSPTYAKTAAGLAHWRPELCMGQLRLTPDTVDLGLPDYDVTEAAAKGAQTLVIGTAVVGGAIPEGWIQLLVDALQAGLDVAAGVHTRLSSIDRLVEAATHSGRKLIDVRVPPPHIPVGTGEKRSGKRLLTVGTDCALGKKYTALALEREMKARGLNVDFRATGQTGIMISGSGIPVDAVVADFVSGAAEMVSPSNDADHWDVIEGQGSVFHPGYSAVSVGLLVGSQPDAFVVCTEAGRTQIKGWPSFELPSIGAVIQRTLDIGAQVNPSIRCVGISVNTSMLSELERAEYLAQLSSDYGLPAVDPIALGVGPLVDFLAED